MALGVVAQHGNERAVSLAERIRATIGADEVTVDASTGRALGIEGVAAGDLGSCDLVTSIGGDGTFLFAARRIGTTPIMGVNLGEVGFLTRISPEEALETVADIYADARSGTLETRTIPRIAAHGDDWTIEPALNEVMVHAPQRGAGHGIDVDVHVDGARYDRSHVDGIMIATPAGSTAYNLSERGPLVAPGVDACVINQMCSRRGRPPLVVPLDAVIEISFTEAPFAYVVGDGRAQQQVEAPDVVTVARSDSPLAIAGPPVQFFDALDRLS